MCDKMTFRYFDLFTRFKAKLIVIVITSILIIYGFSQRNPLIIKEYSLKTNLKKSPPIVTEIMGGLGNQFFQYAAAYSIAKKRNSDIYICINGWDVSSKTFISSDYSSEQRKYSLNQFNVSRHNRLYFYPSVTFKWNKFDMQCSIDYYLNGRKVENVIITEADVMRGDFLDEKVLLIKDFFESDIFFSSYRHDILNMFQPMFDSSTIRHLVELVTLTLNSVSVHIRRGDMGRKEDFRIISISYQREAMRFVKQKLNTKNVTFFVFTDDINYVKKHLEEPNGERDNIIYMSEFTKENTLYDFLLMSNCQHNIIPNSSFSWWAAYLNKNRNKIVIAPMPKYSADWINEQYDNSSHNRQLIGELAYPKDWFTIKPTFENYSNTYN